LVQKDQRLFEANEIQIPAESGFADVTEFLEDILEKSTARILTKIKASTWWQAYVAYNNATVNSLAGLPDVDANKIKSRQQDFTDAAVFYAFCEYILPLIADFSEEAVSSEVQKIQYYRNKFEDRFEELIRLADWYDYDGDGTVEDSEKVYSYSQNRRTRRRLNIVRVR
jgi:hypothetical protein